MTTRTELSRLLEVESQADKAKLMDEVMSWKEYEASFKGRELWITALKGWCENRYPRQLETTELGFMEGKV
jgi:hypothetical protein